MTCAFVAVAALLALVGAGCSQRGVPLEDAPLPFRQAEDNFRLGNYEKAVRGYQVFLDSESSDDYEELVPRAYYRMAMSEYRRGRYSECLAVLDRMERRLPDREWAQVDMLRGDAELARGNPISALRWWEEGWKIADGDEKREARQHIVDALDRMDPSALARARTVLTTEEMQALVDARLRSTGGAGPPKPNHDRGRRSRRPAVRRSRAVAARRRHRRAAAAHRGAAAAQRPVRDLRAALAERHQARASGRRRDGLVVRDTQGEAPVARAALDELIGDPTIVAVIGPLRSKVAEAVAPRAERGGLPMVVLSQQEGISGRWVVQPAMTAERQAAELAEYSVNGQGLRKFGILYPNDQYGIALSQAFRQQVEQRGGRVVGSVTYDPKQKEFSVELLSLDKWIKDDGLQAVFIPDFAADRDPARRAAASRPPRAWCCSAATAGTIRPRSVRRRTTSTERCSSTASFASSQRRATQEFVDAYRSAYGGTPEILEAQAYDAAKLVTAALHSGARSRSQVIAALQTPRSFEGAAGTVAVGPHGIQRQLFLLRVASGNISEVVPTRPALAPVSAPPTAARRTERRTRRRVTRWIGTRRRAPRAGDRSHRRGRDANSDARRSPTSANSVCWRDCCRRSPRGRDVVLGPGDDCAVVHDRRGPPVAHRRCAGRGRAFSPRLADPAPARPQGLSGQRQRHRRDGRRAALVCGQRRLRRRTRRRRISPRSAAASPRRRAKTARSWSAATSRAPRRLAVAVALVGDWRRARPLRRRGARPGDLLYVTGRLGDAALGVRALGRDRRARGPAVRRFREPPSRWRAGVRLARSGAVDRDDRRQRRPRPGPRAPVCGQPCRRAHRARRACPARRRCAAPA